MKLTRSLAAKAIANANVPIKTIGRRMLPPRSSMICKITAETAKIPRKIVSQLAAIQSALSGVMNDAPLAPLTRMKYVIEASAIPPQMAP